MPNWTAEALDLCGSIEALDLGSKKTVRTAMKLLYVAIEGRAAGLPLFDSMHLLGREASLARLPRHRDSESVTTTPAAKLITAHSGVV